MYNIKSIEASNFVFNGIVNINLKNGDVELLKPANEAAKEFWDAVSKYAADTEKVRTMAEKLEQERDRARQSLYHLQQAAGAALEAIPEEQQTGIVAEFLASIHRVAVQGQLASLEVINEAADHPNQIATHRHKKRGTEYILIGFGKMQAEKWFSYEPDAEPEHETIDMREVAIYLSIDDDSLWVRPIEEFEDGRFEKI